MKAQKIQRISAVADNRYNQARWERGTFHGRQNGFFGPQKEYIRYFGSLIEVTSEH